MEEIIEEFSMPKYYIENQNHLIKQVDKVSIVSVQSNDNEKGEFIHSHFSTKFSSEKKCNEYLDDLIRTTEEKYESLLATFFQKSDQNRKIFNIYRQAKWKKENL